MNADISRRAIAPVSTCTERRTTVAIAQSAKTTVVPGEISRRAIAPVSTCTERRTTVAIAKSAKTTGVPGAA